VLREVEKRVEAMRQTKDTADDQAKLKNRPLFTMDRPANGLPEDLREHTRLMCDIIAIAFQTDKTRIATLILARDLGALYYPFLGVSDGHHSASHANNTDGYERIAQFHLSQTRILGQPARPDARRQWNRTGSFLLDVALQFVDRPQARQYAIAIGFGGRPGRDAADGAHVELPECGRREP